MAATVPLCPFPWLLGPTQALSSSLASTRFCFQEPPHANLTGLGHHGFPVNLSPQLIKTSKHVLEYERRNRLE
uniref:Uncharacterized protein n=1 Tax=Peromyscus maniculatus bairdii TaxID=230844 RepID=A0A8C8W2I7_PERMB